MNRSIRFLLTAAAAVVSLAFAGSAFAAYNPSLIVAGTNHSLGAASPLVIGIGQDENDDASGMATVYSPLGYNLTLNQAPGTVLGALSGVVKVGAQGGARVEVQGTVKTDNPANHVSNACSPGTHEAVWILEYTVSGNVFRLPIYVDRVTTAPESAYASARLRVCPSSPYIPPPQGAASGASPIVLAFSIRSVFTNPTARGSYPWNGVFVPYTPGSGTLNPANSAQSTSFVRLPVQFTMTVKRQKRGKRTFGLITSCLKEGGVGIRGIRVNVLGGATVRRAKRVASGRTNARGCTTSRIRVRKTMVVLATADVPARQAPGCQPAIVPRCSEPSVAPAFDLFTQAKRVRR